MREDKEHLEFLLAQSRGESSSASSSSLPQRVHSPAMDIDVQEEEEGGGAGAGPGDASEYEVPEKIKTLHHLVLQYVNQVSRCLAMLLSW